MKKRIASLLVIGAGLLATVSATARAEVKLPAVLSSHMVLQRDLPVPVWGTAAPGEKVAVKFRDQEKSVVADPQGKWVVKLDPLKAGGPDALTVAGGANTLTLDDVLVGEVWLGSGQSNMSGRVGNFAKNDPVLTKDAAAAPYPKIRLMSAGAKGWEEATEKNVDGFSAILFAFGLPLHRELDVPVGLLVGAVGGTPSGYWLSEEAYASDAACKEAAARFGKTYDFEAAQKEYPDKLAKWEAATAHAKEVGRSAGPKPQAPLRPGECNAKVGHLYEQHVRPFLPFAIRGVLWDQGESGTAIQGVDQYTLMGALIRGWRKEWSDAGGPGDFHWIYIEKPSGGGCAWDPHDPVTNQASPFAPLPPAVPNDGQYRETHIRITQYPNTAMAISSDLGSMTHPVNKSGYGARAARVALGSVYGRKVEYYGPVYQSHKVEGGKVRITYAHLGQGLASPAGQKLQGFAVASEDKKFYWADAAIDGESVVLSSDQVANPVAVRYGWAASIPWANLFNKDGLPAVPFRTDAW